MPGIESGNRRAPEASVYTGTISVSMLNNEDGTPFAVLLVDDGKIPITELEVALKKIAEMIQEMPPEQKLPIINDLSKFKGIPIIRAGGVMATSPDMRVLLKYISSGGEFVIAGNVEDAWLLNIFLNHLPRYKKVNSLDEAIKYVQTRKKK